MAKIRLTKNELKNQRDALKRFERYLPTLQLKKQQLQLEVRILKEELATIERDLQEQVRRNRNNLTLFASEDAAELKDLLEVESWQTGLNNVAGTDVPTFESLSFFDKEYDLFTTPLWFDEAIILMKSIVELRLKYTLIEEQLDFLEQELRIVTQRVNLFEKVKIPESKENIRKINIYLGDLQTNAVGRAKIAKNKCQQRDAVLA